LTGNNKSVISKKIDLDIIFTDVNSHARVLGWTQKHSLYDFVETLLRRAFEGPFGFNCAEQSEIIHPRDVEIHENR